MQKYLKYKQKYVNKIVGGNNDTIPPPIDEGGKAAAEAAENPPTTVEAGKAAAEKVTETPYTHKERDDMRNHFRRRDRAKKLLRPWSQVISETFDPLKYEPPQCEQAVLNLFDLKKEDGTEYHTSTESQKKLFGIFHACCNESYLKNKKLEQIWKHPNFLPFQNPESQKNNTVRISTTRVYSFRILEDNKNLSIKVDFNNIDEGLQQVLTKLHELADLDAQSDAARGLMKLQFEEFAP
jgi:hypothetical protein